jgi:Ca2+-binding RTX toxin-like protein
MVRSFLQALLRDRRRRFPARRRLPSRFAPRCEGLETRLAPAVTAFFLPGAGLLSVLGDALDNTITVSRNAAGILLVNGGAVQVKGGSPTVANTAQITVFGLGGNDRLELNEASGALPRSVMQGGEGNDTLIGGAGNDQLIGQSGNDNLQGKGGIDLLFGGQDNDLLTGGDSDDQVFGESGNDRMVWNPGDDTDLNEGGAGSDTVEVNGGGGAEAFTVTVNGARVRFDRLDPAPFALNIGTSEQLVLNANGGNDTFAATGNLAALIKITADGGAGNDTLTGSNGPDLLLGGDGNDLVDGNQGNDVVFLGAGDDTAVFNPSGGSDTIEGQDGLDKVVFNGSSFSELFELSANGARLRLTRSVANIVFDVDGVERVDLNAFGGADTVTLNDLSGTDVRDVRLDLATTPGGAGGDGQSDTVIVHSTSGNDVVEAVGTGASYSVAGLAALVSVRGSEGANDRLTVNGLAGDDVVDAKDLAAGVVRLTANGGAGNDVLIGSVGNDTLQGGDGDDVVIGGPGLDTLDGGPGDNVVIQG